MAFTKAPTESTYKTQRVTIVGNPMQRNGLSNKDQRFLNCFPEKIEAPINDVKQYYLRKRPGLTSLFTYNPGGQTRGMIYEDTTKKVFFVSDNHVVCYDGTTLNNFLNIGTSSGQVGFTVHLATSISVVLLDGVNGYVINPVALTATQITDPDFPTPHITNPISLDGYLFVAKAGTADIYNSDLDDPLSWTPGNVITAEMYPDNIVALTKNNNYLYAVGTGSVEYFYDAGNPTGSPIQRNDSAVQQFGTPAPYSVVQTEKEVILVGSTANGGRTVWMLEGFKAKEIGIEAVKMALDAEEANISNCTGYSVRAAGHKFYVMRFGFSKKTWVYDFMENLWHEWSSLDNDNLTQGLFRGAFSCDSPIGYPYMLDPNNGKFYKFTETEYTDDGKPIYMQATTLKYDFGNMNRKDLYRLSIFGDWPANSLSAAILVEWTDDDYRTFQGGRNANLDTGLPVIRRCGKFRRRAFRLTFTESLPLRLEGMEFDMNMGQT